ncbi:MAG: signal peptidase II [Planctomycetota bacterium]
MGWPRKCIEGRRKLFWAFAAATLAFDQVTKFLLWSHPGERQPPVVLVPHLLRIISHEGNVRGALGLGPQGRLLYVLAAGIGLALVAAFFLTTGPKNAPVHAGLGLLAGGAVGNLLDRLAYGFVRDFIDLHWRDAFHWHTFNVADAAICVGFAIVILDAFWAGRSEPSASAGGEDRPEPAQEAGA